MSAVDDDFLIIGGSASRALAASVADYLDRPLAHSETLRFSEGNLFVRVLENVRGRDTFLIQSTAFPANDNFMELLFWVDALKRASAASVTIVMPYFSYAKGDKKDEPRVSIRARVCADAIEAAGADRVVTLDLHAPQLHGFFKVPVDDLQALPVLADAVASKSIPDLVVVAPDAGYAKRARRWADRLKTPLAIAEKRRSSHDEQAEVVELIGEVAGRVALIVDDFTISAGTLVDAARVLTERGAREVYAAVTHGLFAGDAMNKIADSPIRTLFITDSVETSQSPSPSASKSSPSRACSAKPSAGYPHARASPCCSSNSSLAWPGIPTSPGTSSIEWMPTNAGTPVTRHRRHVPKKNAASCDSSAVRQGLDSRPRTGSGRTRPQRHQESAERAPRLRQTLPR